MKFLTTLQDIKTEILNSENPIDWIKNSTGGDITEMIKNLGLIQKDDTFYGKAFMITTKGSGIYLIVNADGLLNLYKYEGYSIKDAISFEAKQFLTILN